MRKFLLLVFTSSVLAFFTISAVRAAEPALLVDSLHFTEEGRTLKTLQTGDLEIYKPDDGKALEMTIKGQIFDDAGQTKQLLTIVIPTLQQNIHTIDPNDPKHFSISISAAELPYEAPIQIMILTHESTPSKVISLILKRETDYPSLINILWTANRSSGVLVLLILLFIVSLVALFTTRQHGVSKAVLMGLSGILLVLLILQSASLTLIQLFRQGSLSIPGQELVLQKKFPEGAEPLTLTRLNDNLEIAPSLSSSWSNIQPLIWEFVLRKGVTPDAASIVTTLQRKSAETSDAHQYLSSVEKIISYNDNRLQFITKFPDPLLPQKLSKVDLRESESGDRNSIEAFLPQSQLPGSQRSVRNEHAIGLAFLEKAPWYLTQLTVDNVEQLKKLIENQTIDTFDEPEPVLWPVLSKNNYVIQPKINTRSLILLTNRNDPILSDGTLIAALKKILDSPRILQTSYFQYGRLANQFAPPGVVGYSPDIDASEEQRSVSELIDTVKSEHKTDALSLTFHYPAQEETLAKAIQSELERSGISVISQAIPADQEEQWLSENPAQLNLLALDFDLADIGPFLDALIDSHSPLNKTYHHEEVDKLIAESRSELNSYHRLELLQTIMKTIVVDDPAGIPLLFKKSFVAKKKPVNYTWVEQWMQKVVLGW